MSLEAAKLKSIEEQYRTEVQAFQEIQKDILTANAAKRQFVQQLHENDMVLKDKGKPSMARGGTQELNIVQDNANVFKLIGPVLVKQDPVEAKTNVEKRLDYIKGELKRTEAQLKGHEERAMSKQTQLAKLQQEAKRLQQHARLTTAPS